MAVERIPKSEPNRKSSLAKNFFFPAALIVVDSIPRPLDHECSTLPLNPVVVKSVLTSVSYFVRYVIAESVVTGEALLART